MKGSFADKLDYLLAERNLTQQEVANAIGIAKNNISRWKTGEITPSRRNKQVLADFLFVTPASLFDPTQELERTYVAKELNVDYNLLPLSDQERSILTMYRELSAMGQMRLIKALIEICDKDAEDSK